MPAPPGAPRTIAFTGTDEKGPGIFVQDFDSGQDTSKTRRRLVPYDPELNPESFGISPDGTRITISSIVPGGNLLLAENVPGVTPPRRGR